MTLLYPPTPSEPSEPSEPYTDDGTERPRGSFWLRSLTGWNGLAGVASIGAGAIHAAAIGIHAEHRQAAIAFTILAALQIAWGFVALVRSGRLVALFGILLGGAAVAGWAVAKTAGISFVEGLDQAESIQAADAIAAGLALVSGLLAAKAFLAMRPATDLRRPMTIAAVGVGALSLFAMVQVSGHSHAGGHGDTGEVAAGHDHGGVDGVDGADAAAAHADAASAVPPQPYDPDEPIDLGGVAGVTSEQQARAERIVATTLEGLPQWADYRDAEAAGFQSIGDGGTGVEHFINQENMDDPTLFDPDVPESLVYDTTSGERRLVAAMYMLERGLPLEEVPDYGGNLMQFHTHENLCYNEQGRLAGLTDSEGNCPPGTIKPDPTPMIHVWIEPHPCGPFAALEGVGGGTIEEGEEILCDHAHGAPA
jgi:hypothetical protein